MPESQLVNISGISACLKGLMRDRPWKTDNMFTEQVTASLLLSLLPTANILRYSHTSEQLYAKEIKQVVVAVENEIR